MLEILMSKEERGDILAVTAQANQKINISEDDHTGLI